MIGVVNTKSQVGAKYLPVKQHGTEIREGDKVNYEAPDKTVTSSVVERLSGHMYLNVSGRRMRLDTAFLKSHVVVMNGFYGGRRVFTVTPAKSDRVVYAVTLMTKTETSYHLVNCKTEPQALFSAVRGMMLSNGISKDLEKVYVSNFRSRKQGFDYSVEAIYD